jgi:hypothetical protein
MPLRGVDSDNGSEFINHDLYAWCQREGVTFTRSRPYHKNDSAHVEQKNGAIVRPLIGYDRYASKAAYAQLARVYDLARLHINFFQPVQKLVTKERRGSRVHRVYDRARRRSSDCVRRASSHSLADRNSRAGISASTPCTCAARLRRPWSGSGPWRSRPGRPQWHPEKTSRTGDRKIWPHAELALLRPPSGSRSSPRPAWDAQTPPSRAARSAHRHLHGLTLDAQVAAPPPHGLG